MYSEGAFLRLPPEHPYISVDLQLRVPIDAVSATIRLLCRAGKHESGVLWYGPKDSAGNGVVAYVVAPRQRMSWGNYTISTAALAEVICRLTEDWRPLAQIHSHPGRRVEHSSYDDRMLSSRRALSLVFPHHGRISEPFPIGIGIHEWQNNYWHLLDINTAKRRVITVDGTVLVEDLR